MPRNALQRCLSLIGRDPERAISASLLSGKRLISQSSLPGDHQMSYFICRMRHYPVGVEDQSSLLRDGGGYRVDSAKHSHQTEAAVFGAATLK